MFVIDDDLEGEVSRTICWKLTPRHLQNDGSFELERQKYNDLMQVFKENKGVKSCENSEYEAKEVKFEEAKVVSEEDVEYVDV